MTLLAGAVIGLTLGALGGGGSILTVPALVYLLAEPPRVATTASLVIVGVASILGAIGHARSGRVRWAAAGIFGVIGIAASFGGAKVNRLVDPNVLLLSFAALMLVAGTAMVLRTRSSSPTTRLAQALTPVSGGGAQAPVTGAVVDRESAGGPGHRASRTATTSKVIVAALLVGFLTGFLGVGGGFIIVPALLLALHYEMPVAVGTSLVIISITSLGALAERLGTTEIPWHTIVPFTAAAVLGSFAGTRVSYRVSGTTLTRAFAGLLVLVGMYVGIQAGSSL